MTTLPVTDLTVEPGRTSLVFPHFAAGGGWSTQFILVNPTDNVLTGMVQFRDPSGRAAVLTVNNQSNSAFAYSIPARSSQKLQAEGTGNSGIVGSVQIVPAANTSAPFGAGILSFRNGGVTVSEASV